MAEDKSDIIKTIIDELHSARRQNLKITACLVQVYAVIRRLAPYDNSTHSKEIQQELDVLFERIQDTLSSDSGKPS